MHLVIASCPSRIGDDDTIMEQVEDMIGKGKGHRNDLPTFRPSRCRENTEPKI